MSIFGRWAFRSRVGGVRWCGLPRPRVKLWQFGLLVVFVAVAIRNLQDQRMTEPALVGLACAGFAAYGLIGCLAWWGSRPLEGRLGVAGRAAVYLLGMGALFLASTWVYLGFEFAYRNGRWL